MTNSSTPDFYLYHTLGCHLCEEAEAIIRPVAAHAGKRYLKVDIADDDSLVELYGIRIPVLYDFQSGEELGWPFDDEAAFLFMSRRHQG